MSKFLHGHALNASIEKIIQEAESQLILVSPFIKLNHRYLDELEEFLERPEVEITVFFGKSDGQYHKSFDVEALKFLKRMPNIKIVYDERLHAKFYANEKCSLLTSMNLYDYSQDNNIEVGVESTRAGWMQSEGLDHDSYSYFETAISKAKVVFERVPTFKKKLLGLTETYEGSETMIDEIVIPEPSPAKVRSNEKKAAKKADEASQEGERIKRPLQAKSGAKPPRKDSPPMGYCIRTGIPIPFDVNRPLSDKAFNSWSQFGDGSYPEAYCHFSGEECAGETSYNRPILRKNWRKAKKWIK